MSTSSRPASRTAWPGRATTPDFADAIFKQICGFGEYGFPESHAYSFALLAYVSLWMKCHEPAIFLAALINSQPMGFYAPSQLVQDARAAWRRGAADRRQRPVIGIARSSIPTPVRPASLSKGPGARQPAIRLGLRLVSSTLASRRRAPGAGPPQRRALPASTTSLAAPGSTRASCRRWPRPMPCNRWPATAACQLWTAAGQERIDRRQPCSPARPLSSVRTNSPTSSKRTEGEAITLDYAATGLTLRRHPLALLRPPPERSAAGAAPINWRSCKDGSSAWACGIVTMRQQPETAKGVDLRHASKTRPAASTSSSGAMCASASVRRCCARACWRWPGNGRPRTAART